MRLIDADYLKNLPFERLIHTDFGDTAIPIEEIDNAPTVEGEILTEEAYSDLCLRASKLRPQGEWFDYIEKNKIVKARHGDYVLYKVDFLLDNLTREVYIMEGARRMRGKEE